MQNYFDESHICFVVDYLHGLITLTGEQRKHRKKLIKRWCEITASRDKKSIIHKTWLSMQSLKNGLLKAL